ncbi:alpha/beta fold hydrolase [Rhodococcus sp. D2-41]|uniref:Alpha/beta fold hydrolase n=1 Tax=Speluncibacter jeojiensis TaxID=2710754 RepID=A0A9X4M6I3_9ACTN|nr:alpha/beta fold hydrolase [Rhodococcus sp. D2-41]MDG3009184.1 alpha/beta fold hydrolase [Rhodococcus sp. D2-41]MDG3016143.1 alpha/beta fold hydrolase [Corynebacteriales bacterium D3-21]
MSLGERWYDRADNGHSVSFGVVGSGPPALFLHGFGLTHHTYRGALRRLAAQGLRVYAPALPGFGGTDALPNAQRNIAGYARWVHRFLDDQGIDEPLTLVGHSFGGGVAIRAAFERSERIRRLVLVNSVGGGVWSSRSGDHRPLRERPLWGWGAAALSDAVATRPPLSALAAIATDTMANALRNPVEVWQISRLARTADLRYELDVLARRGLPVGVVWSKGDTFIPRASFEQLRAALGNPHVHHVPGCHGWLIGNPDRFGAVMSTVLGRLLPDLSVAG